MECTASAVTGYLGHAFQATQGAAVSRVPRSGSRPPVVLRSSLLGSFSRPRPTAGLGKHAGSRVNAWFKFGDKGMNSQAAGIYASQGREDFDEDDVEQYFNYMGILAVEGTYDKMQALLDEGIHPVDILLLLAATEGDVPKIEELLNAGADSTVKDVEGRTAIDRAANDNIRELIQSGAPAGV